MQAFAGFPQGFMSEGRVINGQNLHAWDLDAVGKSKTAVR